MSHLNQNAPTAISSFKLSNLENLPEALQALVKASHYLSIVNAEIQKMLKSGVIDYEVINGFTGLLNNELEQIILLFLDNGVIQNLAKPLPLIAAQLLQTLQSTDRLSLEEIKAMATSIHSISDNLQLISGIAIHKHMEGK